MDASRQLEILTKGCAEVLSADALKTKLQDSLSRRKPLRIKAGFDPSAPDIHLGHTVLLAKLRQFQDLGHQVVFIIGDATARIGDPTGRSQTRPALSAEEVETNARTYQDQAFTILDRKRTEIVYNGGWFFKFRFDDFMNLLARVTVSQMLQRDDFQKRLTQNHPISLMEIFYPLMQAYDSVEVDADVELGGTDQKFNLLLGRELQKAWGKEPQVVITLPLLVGLDGTQKMSKSLANHVGITDPPKEMFGKLMSISDELMFVYYDLLTEIAGSGIRASVAAGRLHPKKAKEELALALTGRHWGAGEAEKARAEFERVFTGKEKPAEIQFFAFSAGEYKLYKIIHECGLARSASEARRLIAQKAVSLDDERISDPDLLVRIDDRERTLKVGTRRFARFAGKGRPS